jgi:DNA-binding GntR family transcriptional regulator
MPAMPPSPSQADRVYGQLRLRLLQGELPEAVALVEQQLAAEYDTSRTPVREALRRLEGDGHLVRDRAGRLRPSAPSIESMAELYEVRVALEELTVRRAAACGDSDALAALHARWLALAAAPRARPDPDFVRTDESFHLAIAAAAGNAVAARMLADLNQRIRVLRMHEFTTAARIGSTIAEHLEIVEAIREREPDAAAAFMRAHVERSALVARRRIGDAVARMRAAR